MQRRLELKDKQRHAELYRYTLADGGSSAAEEVLSSSSGSKEEVEVELEEEEEEEWGKENTV